MKKLASTAVGIALCTAAWSSHAQTGGGTKFGEKGTLGIHVMTGGPMLQRYSPDSRAAVPEFGATPWLGFQTTTHRDPDNCPPPGVPGPCTERSASYTLFYLNPRLHYFVIDNLSIGAEAIFATGGGSTTTTVGNIETKVDRDAGTVFGLMPLIGYNISITDVFSIWPHGGIGFRHWGFTDENGPNPNDDVDYSHNVWFFNADVPFMLHLAPHFSIGAGPGITQTFSNKWSSTQNNVETTLTGYGLTHLRWFNAHVIGYF